MNSIKEIVYNCKQATFLIEKKLISKLSFREDMELRIHFIKCDVCQLYSKQSKHINEMVKQLLKGSNKPHVKLDDKFKDALQGQIEDQLNKN